MTSCLKVCLSSKGSNDGSVLHQHFLIEVEFQTEYSFPMFSYSPSDSLITLSWFSFISFDPLIGLEALGVNHWSLKYNKKNFRGNECWDYLILYKLNNKYHHQPVQSVSYTFSG